MFNSRWSRWFKASIANSIVTGLNSTHPALKVFIEGSPALDKQGDQAWVEIRVDGPRFQPLPNGQFDATVEVNVLLCTIMGEENVYTHMDYRGRIEEILSSDVCVKKLGPAAGDDGSAVATLSFGEVVSNYFGQIHLDNPVEQSTVEVRGFTQIGA